MLFFPYRFALQLQSIPIVTLLVCVLCLGIYGTQFANQRDYLRDTRAFCERGQSNLHAMMYTNATGKADGDACLSFVLGATLAEDRSAYIAKLARESRGLSGLTAEQSIERTAGFLTEEYRDFSAMVPKLKTRELWYQPHSWNPVTMLSSSFAHGNWAHVIGNLFFYFAFAAAVEAILGHLTYALVILALAFGTNIAYSVAMLPVASPLPTVGLSGVVMGMMGLLTYLAPHGKIKCFYWILIKFGVVAVPAWLLFLWYAGFDAYQLVSSDGQSGINLVAHVSGAAIGYLSGLLFFRRHKQDLDA